MNLLILRKKYLAKKKKETFIAEFDEFPKNFYLNNSDGWCFYTIF